MFEGWDKVSRDHSFSNLFLFVPPFPRSTGLWVMTGVILVSCESLELYISLCWEESGPDGTADTNSKECGTTGF